MEEEPQAPFDTGFFRGILRIRHWDDLDVWIAAIGIGTIILLSLLTLFYLILRWGSGRRRRLAKEQRSKADRPGWLSALWLSGMIWLGSTLILTGNVRLGTLDLSEQADNPVAWLLIKWLGQLSLGWALFYSLVLYRIVRIWLRLSQTEARARGSLVLITVWLPSLVGAIIVITTMPTTWIGWSVHEMRQSNAANWIALLGQLFYLLMGAVFAGRVLRIGTGYHEMRRYNLHLASLSLFTLLEAFLQLSPWRESFWLLRLMPCLVIFLVTFNLLHPLILALRPKRPRKSAADEEEQMRESPLDPDAEESEVSSEALQESLSNLNDPNGLYWQSARRRQPDRQWQPDYETWRRGLNSNELEQVPPLRTLPAGNLPRGALDLSRDLEVMAAILKR